MTQPTMQPVANADTLTQEERDLAKLLADPTIGDSIKAMLASTMRSNIALRKAAAEAAARAKAAEDKTAKAKARKELLANGPCVVIEEPGRGKEGKPYSAKVMLSPWGGAHFFSQVKMTPAQWRVALTPEIVQDIYRLCDECDKLYPPETQTADVLEKTLPR